MPDLDFVQVVGRLGLVVADSPSDPDRVPETIWCDAGEVWFTPLTTITKAAGAVPVPATLGQSTIKVPIDSEGYLSLYDTRTVYLVDLTSTKLNPYIPNGKATHRVEFREVKANGIPISFPGFNGRFAADTAGVDGTVDITLAAPVSAVGGTPILVGPQGTSVSALSLDGDELVYLLSDGTEDSAGVLPLMKGDTGPLAGSYVEDPAKPGFYIPKDVASNGASIDDHGVAQQVKFGPETKAELKKIGTNIQARAYGVGDGRADDTSAMVAALAASKGLTLELPGDAVITLNAPFVLDSTWNNTTIVGNGARLKVGSAPTGDLNTRGRFFSVTGSDITISGLNILPIAGLVTLTSTEKCMIQSTGARNKFVDCVADALGTSAAVDFLMCKGLNANDNVVAQNNLNGCGISYSYGGASRTKVHHNIIRSAIGNGLTSVGNGGTGVVSADCELSYNTIISAGRFGIEDHGTTGICRGTRIIGNTIMDSVSMGISAVGECTVISANRVLNSGNVSIETTSGNNLVTNNEIVGSATTPIPGIRVDSTPTNGYEGCEIIGNHLKNVQVDFFNGGFATVAYNVFQDWTSNAVGPGAKVISYNYFKQTRTDPTSGRIAIQFAADARVVGNTILYVGTGGGETAIKPASSMSAVGSTATIADNVVDGGGAPVTISTNGGTGILGCKFEGNILRNGANFVTTGFVNFLNINNIGFPVTTGGRGVWAAYGQPAVAQPSLTYSRATETAAGTALRQALVSLGLVADNTVA